MGTAKSRNIGVLHAKGKYIAFIDSDDLWHKDKIEKQVRLLAKKNSDLCYTASVIVDKNTILGKRTVPLKTDYKKLLKENTIACSSVLIKKDKLLPFDSRYFHEDYALWLRLLKNGCKAVGINKPLLCYHLGGRSADKKNAAKHRWEIYRKSEQFGVLKSAYYFLFYACNGLLNALKINKF
jgi:teichuronic acid biosynthesis glycosyltransferase TuaG